jgi:branched-chain amino acid transport system substrate-binding protein
MSSRTKTTGGDMHHRKRRNLGLIAGAAGLAVLLAACSNNNSSGSTTTTTSSGSSTTAATSSSGSGVTVGAGQPIVMGSIATLTGAIASNFNGTPAGMQAYFDYIDSQGGVHGHKFLLKYDLDDGSNPATFTQLAHTLIEQDHVFGVLASSFFFSPNFFVSTNTPTFGYNVSGNWAGADNLFAAGGSTQNYNAGAPAVAYAIKQTDSKRVAVISYGSAITSSYDACDADATDLTNAGINVVYTDLDAGLGATFTSAVQRMQADNVDFVLSCMQASDSITMARELQQYGLTHIHQLWFDGYDQGLLQQYNSIMQGVYLNANGSVPFDAVNAYPGRYPGEATYQSIMKKYEPNFVFSQEALQGWQSAALLVAGVKAAGTNVTQASVIAQMNQINDDTGEGVADVTNWNTGHNEAETVYPLCSAFVQVKGDTFVPALNPAPGVFDCFGPGKAVNGGVPSPLVSGSGTPSDIASKVNLKNPVLVAPPAGTPGT